MRLSIIIPAFNEEKILAATLGRITLAFEANRDDEALWWELIVCDNNSTDQTADIAARAGATVIFEPLNHIAKARNTGASIAQGEWLLFIDADTYPSPPLVAEMLKVMRHDEYIGCSSTIRVEDGPLWYKVNLEGHNLEMRLFKTCMGLFMLCRAEAFRALGGFSMDLYAFEDLEFVNRLKRYGRERGQRFAILHRYPVVTSGRKGHLYDQWTMTRSAVMALWYFVTKRKAASPHVLPFWYDGRR